MEFSREFELFFKENENMAYRVAMSYVRKDDIARDILLEAMFRVYARWERVRGMENSKGYLVRIAVNLAKGHLIKNRALRVFQLARDEDVRSPAPGPEESFFLSEENRWIEGLLCGLRDDERKAVVLKDLESKKFEEVAAIMGMKLPTVKSLYRRAKLKMADKMEEGHEN